MVYAVPKVEINFRPGLTSTNNWIDVTDDVLGTINIHRGRQSELEQYSAGTCSFTLINRTRKYDFSYTAGPYYGNLVPRNQLRITCTYSAVTYPIWFGYIDGWPQSYDYQSAMATVEIHATDMFDLLAQTQLVTGVKTSYLKTLDPDFWYRFAYPDGVSDDSDLSNIVQVTTNEDGTRQVLFLKNSWANANDGEPIEAGIDTVARFVNTPFPESKIGYAFSDIPANTPLLSNTNTFSVGGWFKTRPLQYEPNTSGVGGMFSIGGQVVPGGVQFNWQWTGLPGYVNSRFIANVRHWQAPATGITLTVDGNYADDRWHFYCLTNAPSNTVLYIDGKVQATNTGLGSLTLDDSVGCRFCSTSGGGRGEWNGWCYDVFGFNRTLSATEIDNLYQASINLPNQLSGARLSTLFQRLGFGSLPNSFAVGQSVMQPVSNMNDSMLDELQKITKAEEGHLYVENDGTLTFLGRHYTLTASRCTTVQATFDDTGAGIRYLDTSPTLDTQFLYNQVNTSIDGGSTYQVNDVVSQANYGVRNLDRTGLILRSENDAIAQAQWSLIKFSSLKARLPSVTFDPRASNAAMIAALDLTLLDLIRVVRKPQNIGTAWTFDLHIEGINLSIDIGNLDWKVTYNLTQFGTQTGFLRLDIDHLDTGKLAG